MAARLAWPPLPWREWPAVLGVALIAGLLLWFAWAQATAAGHATSAPAKVISRATIPYSKSAHPPALMEVQFADGRRGHVSAPFAQLRRCQIGDTVTVVGVPTHGGAPDLRLDPGSCG